MNKLFFGIVLSVITCTVNAQFVAKMEIKEPIEGICDADAVYALFSMFDGQIEAKCPVSKEEILARLNAEVQYIKDYPKF